MAANMPELVSQTATQRRSREGLIADAILAPTPVATPASDSRSLVSRPSGRPRPTRQSLRPLRADPSVGSADACVPGAAGTGAAGFRPCRPRSAGRAGDAVAEGRQQPIRRARGPNACGRRRDGAYVPGPIFGENSPFRDGPPDGGPPPRPLGIDIRPRKR